MSLYRWYLMCDVALLAIFVAFAILWGDEEWIIPLFGAYLFGRDTSHEKCEAAFYEERQS